MKWFVKNSMISMMIIILMCLENIAFAVDPGDIATVEFEVLSNSGNAVAVTFHLEYDHEALDLLSADMVQKDKGSLFDFGGIQVGKTITANFLIRKGTPDGEYTIVAVTDQSADINEKIVASVEFSVPVIIVGKKIDNREDQYLAAIREIQGYVENTEEADVDLHEAITKLNQLETYAYSYFLNYYANILVRLQEDNYDNIFYIYLDIIQNNAEFTEFLEKEMKGSLGTVAELNSYVQGRKEEREGNLFAAALNYSQCLDYMDASLRYTKIQQEAYEPTYATALELLGTDLLSAYFEFEKVQQYRDSELFMESIVRQLGYIPGKQNEKTERPENSVQTPIMTPTPTVIPTITLIVTAGNDGNTLTWSTINGAVSFSVQRRRTNDASYSEIATTNVISYTDHTAYANNAYYYRIIAILSNGNIMVSDEKYIMTKSVETPSPQPTATPTKQITNYQGWPVGSTCHVYVDRGKVRNGPGQAYKQIDNVFVYKGNEYTILDLAMEVGVTTEKDWYKISVDGTTCWISSSVVDVGGNREGSYYAKNNQSSYGAGWPIGSVCRIYVKEGKARQGPGTDYRAVANVYLGDEYIILAMQMGNTGKDWYKIKLNGTECWIASGIVDVRGYREGTKNGIPIMTGK